MTLDQKDIEFIDKVVYKNSDDVAVSLRRSLERLEERIDASDSRLLDRFADIEDKLDRLIEVEDELLDPESEGD